MSLSPNYAQFEDDIEDSLEWSTRSVFGQKFSDAIDNYLANAVYGGPNSPVLYTGSGTRPVEFELDFQTIEEAATQISDELQYYFEQSFTQGTSGNLYTPTYQSNDYSLVASTSQPLLVEVFSRFNTKRVAAEDIAAALEAGIRTFTTTHEENGPNGAYASYPNIPID